MIVRVCSRWASVVCAFLRDCPFKATCLDNSVTCSQADQTPADSHAVLTFLKIIDACTSSSDQSCAAMADDISAEEKRQLDLAIALSLAQDVQSNEASEARATARQRSSKPILIDDSSSENEEPLSNAGPPKQGVRSFSSINPTSTKKHDATSGSVDSSATEESDDEVVPVSSSSVNRKRKASPGMVNGANDIKKQRSGSTSGTVTGV